MWGRQEPGDVLVLEQKLAGDLGRYFSSNLPKAKTHGTRRAMKQPATLPSRTLVEYGRALEAYDAGDKQKAKDSLSKVLKDQPDFQLATLDLDKMMK